MPTSRIHVRPRPTVLFVPPGCLAASRWERLVAAACCFALATVVIAEVATPDDVVVVVAFIPLMVAMWTLSTWLATAVGAFAAACFLLVLVSEVGNRPTVLFIGAVGLLIAITVRVYANALMRSPQAPGMSIDAADGVEALTQREFQVAQLAARGHSALEIAHVLHISDRTVESHLANAYSKLGIHSRSALRASGIALVER